MADEDSQPEGLEALLQTLDPERQKILLLLLEQDHLAALGAELVGPRAFSPESTGPGTLGWTSRIWGDITLSEEPPGGRKRKDEQEILKQASEGLELSGKRLSASGLTTRSQEERTGKDYRTAAEKLLYKDGILQPFVLFKRSRPTSPPLPPMEAWRDPGGEIISTQQEEPKAPSSVLDEMQTLVHELRHVGDVWQTDRRADMDAEFSGSGRGWEDYREYDQPRILTLAERYKSDPVYSEEPYAHLMDRYNQERLRDEGYQLDSNAYRTRVQKLGYIPDRYQMSLRPRSGWKHDPFATGYSTWSFPSEVESREAAGHPAQGGALTELNRRKGRDPLEGMDQWLQRHGR